MTASELDFSQMDDLLWYDDGSDAESPKEREEQVKDLRDHRLRLRSQIEQLRDAVISGELKVRAINLALAQSPERLPKAEVEKERDRAEWSLALDQALYDVTDAYLKALPEPPEQQPSRPTRQQRRASARKGTTE